MKTVARKSKRFDSPSPTISFRIQRQAKMFFLCLLRQDNSPLRSDSQVDCGVHTSLWKAFHTSFKTNFAYVSETKQKQKQHQKAPVDRKHLETDVQAAEEKETASKNKQKGGRRQRKMTSNGAY